jgi:hypothetical protein
MRRAIHRAATRRGPTAVCGSPSSRPSADRSAPALFFIHRVPETDPAVLAVLHAEEEIVQQEDLWMTAALRRDGMPLVGAPDLHVRSDGNAILYRRVMRNLFDGPDAGK